LFAQKSVKRRANARSADKIAPSRQAKKSSGNSGELNLLRRSIDLDPFAPTFEEKIFRNAKRVCAVFAAMAVTLSALDLMHVNMAGASIALRDGASLGSLPGRIRAAIASISLLPTDQVAVAIPREASPVAALAAVRQQDAVEWAMGLPAGSAKPDIVLAALPMPSVLKHEAPATAAPQPAAAQLPRVALVAATSEPSMPAVIPVSLPMSGAIPLDAVPIPRPGPGAPPPSPAEMLHLEGKAYARAEHCLANAVYFESRSEPVRGQMAVAQVVMNRVFSGFYPNDVCSVVYQNANRHLACQFTFACDGKRKVIEERGAWARANRIAKETLEGKIYVSAVGASTHYHAIYVHPNWVGEMHKLVRYGIHNFYRPIAWGSGSDEPVWGTAALAANKKK
jgi:hypothetical protein